MIKGIAAVLLAAVITGVTAILPMVAAVGKVIYANNVAVVFISMEFGPLGGILYTVLSSFILNNMGMGSGVLIYVLLFQIAEAGILGLIWHKRSIHIVRYALTVAGCTFLLKPLSYVLFYIFNSSILDTTFITYVRDNYLLYLQTGWKDTMLIYGTGILAAYLLKMVLDMIFKKLEKEKDK